MAAEVLTRPPVSIHTDAVIYEVTAVGGELRPEVGGTTDAVRWMPWEEAAGLPLSPVVARTLGLPVPDLPQPPGSAPVPRTPPEAGPRPRPGRHQRFAAYGLVTDPDGRVLLTRNAHGYPAAGRWHLPGGGTDFGEQPVDGLLREIMEESGQAGSVTGLLAVTHRRNRSASGPDGSLVDWHGVRAVYRVDVPAPTPPRVLEVGGSTSAVGWFTRQEAGALPLTDIAEAVLGRHDRQPDDPDLPSR